MLRRQGGTRDGESPWIYPEPFTRLYPLSPEPWRPAALAWCGESGMDELARWGAGHPGGHGGARPAFTTLCWGEPGECAVL